MVDYFLLAIGGLAGLAVFEATNLGFILATRYRAGRIRPELETVVLPKFRTQIMEELDVRLEVFRTGLLRELGAVTLPAFQKSLMDALPEDEFDFPKMKEELATEIRQGITQSLAAAQARASKAIEEGLAVGSATPIPPGMEGAATIVQLLAPKKYGRYLGILQQLQTQQGR